MPKAIHLHQRDIEILELLADRRVETLDVLHERLWPEATRKTAYNRLWKLSYAGYLEHIPRYEKQVGRETSGRAAAAQHLYTLGPKAPTALRIRDRPSHGLARRRVKAGMPSSLVDHQLATNRVGDWLGARLMSEQAAAVGLENRYRPDAAYHASPDERDRSLMLVEVDLGHYSRRRVLDKVQGFFEHPEARGILFAAPTHERANLISRWLREQYDSDVMAHLQVYSFDELQRGAPLDHGTEPARLPADNRHDLGWEAAVMGRAGVV